eukprot:Skav226032  [mRNA]  locus=scaffold2502:78836:80884:- [translate_table: standard]
MADEPDECRNKLSAQSSVKLLSWQEVIDLGESKRPSPCEANFHRCAHVHKWLHGPTEGRDAAASATRSICRIMLHSVLGALGRARLFYTTGNRIAYADPKSLLPGQIT